MTALPCPKCGGPLRETPSNYECPSCGWGKAGTGVSDKAVEAALEVFFDDGHNGIQCDPQPGLDLTVRAALEAAQPFMGVIPLASRERVAEVVHDALAAVRPADSFTGVVVNALLAAGVFREPPTAEQIAMRLSLVRFSDEESDRMIELTMREAWPLADAVVELITDETKCTCPTDAGVTPDMRTETRQHLAGCPFSSGGAK